MAEGNKVQVRHAYEMCFLTVPCSFVSATRNSCADVIRLRFASGQQASVVQLALMAAYRLEKAFGTIVRMQDTQTVITNPKDGVEKVILHVPRNACQIFNFDHSFWSANESDPHFASQEFVYSCLGRGVLENAFDGYNACILAYGQTGKMRMII